MSLPRRARVPPGRQSRLKRLPGTARLSDAAIPGRQRARPGAEVRGRDYLHSREERIEVDELDSRRPPEQRSEGIEHRAAFEQRVVVRRGADGEAHVGGATSFRFLGSKGEVHPELPPRTGERTACVGERVVGEKPMLVAALPVRVAFLPGVEAGGSVPTDRHVIGADLLSLLGSAGLPESADAELALNKLRLDHEDQVLAADVRPLDEDVAVNTTTSGLVVEDVARRRVLELDRLHACE